MNVTDMRKIRATLHLRDLTTAFMLLTRLPLPAAPHAPGTGRAAAHAAWAYPLVGLGVGLIAVAIAWVMQSLGVVSPITALFVVLSSIVVTGAMHEDGLADCADGFWGGWDMAKRLSIMKDSQIGTYGVIALVMSLLLRWYVITQMIEKDVLMGAVLTAAVMSRGAMVWVMYRLPHARKDGLAQQTGRPMGQTTMIAVGFAALAAVLAPEVSTFWLIVVAVLSTLGVATLARRKIGGQTGDVLGATQQIVELGILIAFDTMVYDWTPD
jgi:adenosylcobinamide-GDP ribazoletransferase